MSRPATPVPARLGQTLIVAPAVDPSRIWASLEAAGLTLEANAQRTLSLVAGEPELAVWTRGGGKPIVVYTFNPVARLRVLDVSTAPPALRGRIAAGLELLDEAAVTALLDGPTQRDMLRGLWAARATERIDLLREVANLAKAAAPPGAQEAEAVLTNLEGIADARLQALAMLRVLELRAGQILERLHLPEVAADLRPTDPECARLFDATAAPLVVAGLHQRAEDAVTRPPPRDARYEPCAAAAGLLRWHNERSARFPQGYRDIAGWMTAERIWLTWSVEGPTGGRTRYDGLAWTGERWVWLPRPYRLLTSLTEAGDATPA